jgi:hypothetical protein
LLQKLVEGAICTQKFAADIGVLGVRIQVRMIDGECSINVLESGPTPDEAKPNSKIQIQKTRFQNAAMWENTIKAGGVPWVVEDARVTIHGPDGHAVPRFWPEIYSGRGL